VKFRRVIVDWLCEVGDEYQLSPTTVHMAVHYLDRILGSVDVAKKQLQLVSMCCILIAAKYEEKDDHVPSVEDLNQCSENTYTPELIKEMEIMVLNRLEWNLGVVVPNHFLKLYSDQGIVVPADKANGKSLSKRTVHYLKKYLDFFADLCQQEYSFQQYLPSMLAAAIIGCARSALHFEAIWNKDLEALTNYTQTQLFPCYVHLWTYYEKNFLTQRCTTTRTPKMGIPDSPPETENQKGKGTTSSWTRGVPTKKKQKIC